MGSHNEGSGTAVPLPRELLCGADEERGISSRTSPPFSASYQLKVIMKSSLLVVTCRDIWGRSELEGVGQQAITFIFKMITNFLFNSSLPNAVVIVSNKEILMKGDFDECGRNRWWRNSWFWLFIFTSLFLNCVGYVASKSVVIVKYELETRVKTW
jgi:quinol-cytochrome oxidoreductase complex cytochrome b subunit